MNITLLGTGNMGHPMARRLCQAGHTVHVWNRNTARAQDLAALGATVHGSAAQAARASDIIVSMLENGAVVGEPLPNSALRERHPGVRQRSLHLNNEPGQSGISRDRSSTGKRGALRPPRAERAGEATGGAAIQPLGMEGS